MGRERSLQLLTKICGLVGLRPLGIERDRVQVGRQGYYRIELILERTSSKVWKRPGIMVTPRFLPAIRSNLNFSDVLGYIEYTGEDQFIADAAQAITTSHIFAKVDDYDPAFFLECQQHLRLFPMTGTISTAFCNGISMALCGRFALARRVLASAYARSFDEPTMRHIAVYAREALNCVEDRVRLDALIDRIEADFPERL